MASTIAPTLTVMVFGAICRSMASVGQASTQAPQAAPTQASPSMTYFIGKAIGLGR